MKVTSSRTSVTGEVVHHINATRLPVCINSSCLNTENFKIAKTESDHHRDMGLVRPILVVETGALAVTTAH